MSSARAFGIASRLGLSTALLMYGLIVIGSVVRTTGSGLACPDWPLCEGRWIPRFEFHVLIEWFHRLVALLVSVMLLATVGWIVAHRALRERLGGLAGLALVLLFAQVLLGALTVWKLLHPSIVGAHLGVALLLFSLLLTITLIAQREGGAPAMVPAAMARPPGLGPTLVVATGLTYAQALLGAVVSSNHAGLACPDWPTCNGQWIPPLSGAVGLQFLHRLGAYALTLVMIFTALRARSAPDPALRAGAGLALGLTVAQGVLGVCNVLLGLPPWLSAAHLAAATALLAVMVSTTFRAVAQPVFEGPLEAVMAMAAEAR